MLLPYLYTARGLPFLLTLKSGYATVQYENSPNGISYLVELDPEADPANLNPGAYVQSFVINLNID